MYKPSLEQKSLQKQLLLTSDANQFEKTVTVWGDDWLGYLIFKSRQMQEYMHRNNLGIRFENVIDYDERLRGLSEGKCDLITITVDSYLTNGNKYDYPGVILFLIDESFGGDAIVGGPKVSNLDKLNEKGLKGAFVGYSPSEFLLKSSAAHFKLENLSKNLGRFRKDSSQEALDALRSGKADYAVLWEPFVSKALSEINNTSLVIDTKQAREVIIDVAVASRRKLAEDPETMRVVTEGYFQALHYYLNRPEEMNALASAYSQEDPITSGKMLSGIRFVSLSENRKKWFGLEGSTLPKIVDGIQRIDNILKEVGDISQDKLNGNYYSLIYSEILKQLRNEQEIERVHRHLSAGYVSNYFPSLNESGWSVVRNKVTGTFLNEPVLFKTGQSELTEDFQEKLTAAATKLAHYPYHRLMIEANVSPGQDSELDRQLSEQRALSIKQFLTSSCNLNENRVHAKGLGSVNLPTKYPSESDRAWKRRCRRAKILLVLDASLRKTSLN